MDYIRGGDFDGSQYIPQPVLIPGGGDLRARLGSIQEQQGEFSYFDDELILEQNFKLRRRRLLQHQEVFGSSSSSSGGSGGRSSPGSLSVYNQVQGEAGVLPAQTAGAFVSGWAPPAFNSLAGPHPSNDGSGMSWAVQSRNPHLRRYLAANLPQLDQLQTAAIMDMSSSNRSSSRNAPLGNEGSGQRHLQPLTPALIRGSHEPRILNAGLGSKAGAGGFVPGIGWTDTGEGQTQIYLDPLHSLVLGELQSAAGGPAGGVGVSQVIGERSTAPSFSFSLSFFFFPSFFFCCVFP